MNYKERFTKAIEMITNETPPERFVDSWIIGEPNQYGGWDLQEWILMSDKCPWWCQGIILIEAAGYIAKTPIEGYDFNE